MKKNMNNRSNAGFSLVELIIVIAIMAVLIGVLAPQFIKYVESSRKSTDIQNVSEIVTAINTYCADPDNNPALVAGTLTLTAGNVVDTQKTFTDDEKTPQRALHEYGIEKYGLKSTGWGTTETTNLILTVTVTSGVPKCEITSGQKTTLDIIKGDKKE